MEQGGELTQHLVAERLEREVRCDDFARRRLDDGPPARGDLGQHATAVVRVRGG